MTKSPFSDYQDDGKNILLDANENAYGPGLVLKLDGSLDDDHVHNEDGAAERPALDLHGLNRYPDPRQLELKRRWCRLRNTKKHTQRTLGPEHLFVGVGSDEVIDALFRCFCRPGRDKVLTCPPTYGMYAVSAHVNDVEVVQVPLDVQTGFQLQVEQIREALATESNIKLVYVCSPGNPTGSLLKKEDLQRLLHHPSWNGVMVVDEAYIDFADEGASLAEWVAEWPNLVVMQTLSKAFGLAGIRLGAAFTSPEIACLLNNLKAPYNISSPTSTLAQTALESAHLAVMRGNRQRILEQRDRLVVALPQIEGVGRLRGGRDANFLLVEFLDKPSQQGGRPDNPTALAVYEMMAEKKGVVVRFRGSEMGCEGCLRITVGTKSEVDRFLAEISAVLNGIHQRGAPIMNEGSKELEKAEKRKATAVVS